MQSNEQLPRTASRNPVLPSPCPADCQAGLAQERQCRKQHWLVHPQQDLLLPAPFSQPCSSSRKGGTHWKDTLPKAAASSFGPFGAGSSHTADSLCPVCSSLPLGRFPCPPFFLWSPAVPPCGPEAFSSPLWLPFRSQSWKSCSQPPPSSPAQCFCLVQASLTRHTVACAADETRRDWTAPFPP